MLLNYYVLYEEEGFAVYNNEVMYLDQIIVLVHCVHMEHHLFSAVCVSSVCKGGES